MDLGLPHAPQRDQGRESRVHSSVRIWLERRSAAFALGKKVHGGLCWCEGAVEVTFFFGWGKESLEYGGWGMEYGVWGCTVLFLCEEKDSGDGRSTFGVLFYTVVV